MFTPAKLSSSAGLSSLLSFVAEKSDLFGSCHQKPILIRATCNSQIQMGKMMEQGPVLVITFQAQQINCIRDKTGTVREGDPHKVLRVTHVWALCRDQSEFHPWAAWRLLDIAMMPTEQWL
ncbi:Mitochondrial import inner membrane translocase subunit TIM44 [Fasciolopsis buskii]|uniref:Mitochondrial import inner membrane translocase subunit TIM44 n=1 Tax=Fasciolopsis buskii TaxID=27845 RepID=A0A8E0VG72_9TREM|nr:Mitochondrial import inner membrane translocase subunit TIM44 [Fasciolopsis buski]